MPAGMFGINKVEISDVVNNPPVYLFRHIEVKASVTGFHVKNGYVQPLCHIGRKARVGVSKHQEGIRLFPAQQFAGFSNYITNRGLKR
jgi:hypothetical protein